MFKKDYFIEVADGYRKNGFCATSSIRKATIEEIEKHKSQKCNHNNKELLIFDIPGYAYDIRSCGVCEEVIGFI